MGNYRLTEETVNKLEHKMHDEISSAFECETAEHALHMLIYHEGIHDMANEVRKAIRELKEA